MLLLRDIAFQIIWTYILEELPSLKSHIEYIHIIFFHLFKMLLLLYLKLIFYVIALFLLHAHSYFFNVVLFLNENGNKFFSIFF